jgi:uncharacterized membrane protein
VVREKLAHGALSEEESEKAKRCAKLKWCAKSWPTVHEGLAYGALSEELAHGARRVGLRCAERRGTREGQTVCEGQVVREGLAHGALSNEESEKAKRCAKG